MTSAGPVRSSGPYVLQGLAMLVLLVLGVRVFMTREGETADAQVIGRVNGRPVLASALLEELGRYVDLSVVGPEALRPSRGAALVRDLEARFGAWQVGRAFDHCVYAELADQAIQQARVSADPTQVERRFSAEARAFAGTHAGGSLPYAEYLRRTGESVAGRKRELARDVALEQLLGPPSASDLRAHFAATEDHYTGRRVKLRHILLADERQATTLLKKLRAGADFATRARRHSRERSTARHGGSVAWIRRRGDVPEPLAAAAFELAPGQLGGPVRTVYGWHVITIDAERPGKPVTLEAVLDRLRPALQKARRVAFIVDRRRKARVERGW